MKWIVLRQATRTSLFVEMAGETWNDAEYTQVVWGIQK